MLREFPVLLGLPSRPLGQLLGPVYVSNVSFRRLQRAVFVGGGGLGCGTCLKQRLEGELVVCAAVISPRPCPWLKGWLVAPRMTVVRRGSRSRVGATGGRRHGVAARYRVPRALFVGRPAKKYGCGCRKVSTASCTCPARRTARHGRSSTAPCGGDEDGRDGGAGCGVRLASERCDRRGPPDSTCRSCVHTSRASAACAALLPATPASWCTGELTNTLLLSSRLSTKTRFIPCPAHTPQSAGHGPSECVCSAWRLGLARHQAPETWMHSRLRRLMLPEESLNLEGNVLFRGLFARGDFQFILGGAAARTSWSDPGPCSAEKGRGARSRRQLPASQHAAARMQGVADDRGLLRPPGLGRCPPGLGRAAHLRLRPVGRRPGL